MGSHSKCTWWRRLIATDRFGAIRHRDEDGASGEGGAIILSPACQQVGEAVKSELEELLPDLMRQEAAADRCGLSSLLAGRVSLSEAFTSDCSQNVMNTGPGVSATRHAPRRSRYCLPPATLISDGGATKKGGLIHTAPVCSIGP